MQVCRHCGWENPEIAAFCTNCGTGLGRDKGNGPRFRALGLTTSRVEEPTVDSIDAAWPTAASPGGAHAGNPTPAAGGLAPAAGNAPAGSGSGPALGASAARPASAGTASSSSAASIPGATGAAIAAGPTASSAPGSAPGSASTGSASTGSAGATAAAASTPAATLGSSHPTGAASSTPASAAAFPAIPAANTNPALRPVPGRPAPRPMPAARPVPVPTPGPRPVDNPARPVTHPAIHPIGGVLAQTLVDFVPDLEGSPTQPNPTLRGGASPDDTGHRRTEALVSPSFIGAHAPIARRSTGPMLLPDEADISIDQPTDPQALDALVAQTFRLDTPAIDLPTAERAAPEPPADHPPEPPAAPAEPMPAVTPAVQPDPVLDIVTERTPELEPGPDEDDDEDAVAFPTDPPPAATDSLEEDGFDEFVDPRDRADGEDEDDDGIVSSIDQPGGEDPEIETPDDALAAAINAFSDERDARIRPPSDSPFEAEDELELSTSDLHAVDFEARVRAAAQLPDPITTSPSIRAVPPPLPPAFVPRFILRPFSQNLGERKIVPIGDAPVTIGREDSDIRVSEDLFVSPRHARFTIHDGVLWIDDLGSLNGTWRRVRTEIELRAGDQVLIGQQILRIDAARARHNGVPPSDGTQRFGAPADRSRFRITQIAADGDPLDIYHLPPDGCRLGRRLGDLVFTDDTYMSGTHALLVPGTDTVKLHDLSSRNGCWIRVPDRCRLQIGDAVMIGRTVWRIGRPIT